MSPVDLSLNIEKKLLEHLKKRAGTDIIKAIPITRSQLLVFQFIMKSSDKAEDFKKNLESRNVIVSDVKHPNPKQICFDVELGEFNADRSTDETFDSAMQIWTAFFDAYDPTKSREFLLNELYKLLTQSLSYAVKREMNEVEKRISKRLSRKDPTNITVIFTCAATGVAIVSAVIFGIVSIVNAQNKIEGFDEIQRSLGSLAANAESTKNNSTEIQTMKADIAVIKSDIGELKEASKDSLGVQVEILRELRND